MHVNGQASDFADGKFTRAHHGAGDSTEA